MIGIEHDIGGTRAQQRLTNAAVMASGMLLADLLRGDGALRLSGP